MDEDVQFGVNSQITDIILQVRTRPELWDTSLDAYKNKELKDNKWKEVCGVIFDDFDYRGAEEQELIQKRIHSKWKTVRDSYRKAQKHGLNSSGLRSRHQLLSFLDKSEDPRSTYSPNVETRFENQTPQKANIIQGRLSPPRASSSNNKSNLNEDDDDIAFFKSCLPSIRALNHQQKLKLRIGFMDSIQKMLQETEYSKPEPTKAKRKRKIPAKYKSESFDYEDSY